MLWNFVYYESQSQKIIELKPSEKLSLGSLGLFMKKFLLKKTFLMQAFFAHYTFYWLHRTLEVGQTKMKIWPNNN